MTSVGARLRAAPGLLVLTSPDRLHTDWLAQQRNRGRTVGLVDRSPSPVERLLAPLSRDARLVTVMDGHPLALSVAGLGARPAGRAAGHREVRPVRRHPRSLSNLQARCGGDHRRGGARRLKWRRESRRQTLPHHLARRRTARPSRSSTRPCCRTDSWCATSRTWRMPTNAIQHHGRARRAADRRDGGLRHGAGHGEPTRPTRRWRAPTRLLLESRPTAVNLRWALDDLRALLAPLPPAEAPRGGLSRAPPRSATRMSRSAVASARTGWALIRKLKPRDKSGRINVLTHCNAGWLATVDWGTALAPIYQAHDAGIPIHVWVDETRPRNQGASLTAWELGKHGVPHTVIADNAGGHLMQHGQVDFVHRRHRPHDATRRRLQQDRHLPEGAGRARQRRAVLCRPALSDHRLDDRRRRARASRSRSAARARSRT